MTVAETYEYGEGLAVIAFSRFRSKFMQKYFVSRNRSLIIHIRLETYGTAVWKPINGTRTVEEVLQILSEHFQNEENYPFRILACIQHLQNKDLLS
jgi:hypothetical protein